MKVILGITQLTTDGTKQTASSAARLTALADGLKSSVAGFKLAAEQQDATMADATLLSWINAEVERALTLVRDSIAKFSAAPENDGGAAALPRAPAPGERGAAHGRAERRDAVLRGDRGQLRRTQRPARRAPQTMGVIDRAVLALKDFVGELARGQADVPLRLYPVYRELAALHGKTAMSEKDLFFPDLAVAGAVASASRKAVAEEELARLPAGAARALPARRCSPGCAAGPPAWTRCARPSTPLHQVATQLPEPRALWWAAGGLIDALRASASDAEWLAAAKALCNRIDFQMRDLAAGAAKSGDALLRELLYAIATARSVDAAHQGNQAALPARQPVPARRTAAGRRSSSSTSSGSRPRSTTCTRASTR